MPFGDNEFDFVLHNQVLEHIADEKACIDECLRVLKPGGKCILNIPYDHRRPDNFEDGRFTTAEQRKKHYFQTTTSGCTGRNCCPNTRENTTCAALTKTCFRPSSKENCS